MSPNESCLDYRFWHVGRLYRVKYNINLVVVFCLIYGSRKCSRRRENWPSPRLHGWCSIFTDIWGKVNPFLPFQFGGKILLRAYVFRLTPVYAVIIFSTVALTKYVTLGPYWTDDVGQTVVCHKNWWTNLLYINNLVHPAEAEEVSMGTFLKSPNQWVSQTADYWQRI